MTIPRNLSNLAPGTSTTGVVAVTKGGTGLSSLTTGDIIYGSAANTFSALSGVATGNALISGGVTTAPSWGKIGLTTHVTGTLAVGNGGTGATTLTGVIKGNGASAFTAATAGTDYVAPGTATTFTAVQTFRVASAIRSEAAATQDAIVIAGRAGGTNSYAVTLTPATLASNTTLTLPNVTSTVAVLGTAQTFTSAQTFRAASAVRSEAASTQDAVVLAGRAGGTGSYAVTLTPTTLASNTTLTLPNVTDTLAVLGTAQTFTARQTFSGSTSVLATALKNAAELATVSATAATGTINFDVTTQSVLYYTTNSSANFTINFRASSGTSLNTAMSTGDSVTAAFLCTNGGTAYYNSAVTIDGNSVTPKWQGGSAPTTGNASSVDIYVYTIVKTGSATFDVYASQTQFA